MPWYARLLALIVVAYAFSPIDLIPDPIPVLGYLDDLLLVPAGVWLTVRLIPDEVMVDARAASAQAADRPTSLLGPVIIVGLWVSVIILTLYYVAQSWSHYV